MCGALSAGLCVCLLRLVCLGCVCAGGSGLVCLFGTLQPFGRGKEDKLCFDLFALVCFPWLRSFCRRDDLSPSTSTPPIQSAGTVGQLAGLSGSTSLLSDNLSRQQILLIGFGFSLHGALFIFEIAPFDVCFILKLLLGSGQRAIRRMLNRNCCLRLCCSLP